MLKVSSVAEPPNQELTLGDLIEIGSKEILKELRNLSLT
jgi:hypothetical protein